MGSAADDSSTPAHSPLLNFSAHIDLSRFCGEDIIKYDGILQDIWSGILKETGTWRYVTRENSETVEGAQKYARTIFNSPEVITWDLSTLGEYNSNNLLSLSPGYEFYLRATLKVTTLYYSGFTGNADIKEVKISIVSTSVDMTPLDFSNRNKLILNYIIEFDMAQSTQIFLIAESSVLLDLMTDVGGAMGVLSFGVIFLKIWQAIFGTPPVFLRDVILVDERKRLREQESPRILDRILGIFSRVKKNKIINFTENSTHEMR